MTSKDLEAELDKDPFVPMRVHLVSGKTLTIADQNGAFLLQNALLVLRNKKPGRIVAEGYDVVALRNIERLEQMLARRKAV